MAVRLDPWKNIVNVHWGTQKYFLNSGYLESGTNIFSGSSIPGSGDFGVTLTVRNPDDEHWLATCFLMEVTGSMVISLRTLQLNWTGSFDNPTERGTDEDPKDIGAWMNAANIQFTIGDYPLVFGVGDLTDAGRTGDTWTWVMGDPSIPFFDQRVYTITYPGWEDGP